MSDRIREITPGTNLSNEDIVLDKLPDDVICSMEVRNRWFIRSAPQTADGQSFVVEDLLRWVPGRSIRVAFLGGNTELHRDIEEAARQITESCNITLDFGHNDVTGAYRTWSTTDTEYKAEIRVSFDQGGYFSLVGTDSIAPNIGHPLGPVGGRPNQRSLNLGGFHIQKPDSWRGTTRHEFLHALAFHHEHQSPSGGCEEEFRWQDDVGYQPTRDADGRYVNDTQGRRPGIYTYLAGFPNFWDRQKVDHNLRRLTASGLTTGTFDRASVMLYRFPALFYRSNPSPCGPIGNGQNLSDRDREGLRHLYPSDEPAVQALRARRLGAFESLLSIEEVGANLKEGLKKQLKTITEK